MIDENKLIEWIENEKIELEKSHAFKNYNDIKYNVLENVLSEIDRLQSEKEFCEWKLLTHENYRVSQAPHSIYKKIYCSFCGKKIKEI